MSFVVGSLVRARGREWVVLPGSDEEVLLVRPLGGADVEATGIVRALEPVVHAKFDLPDPNLPGDYRSSRLLRDALRLGFRSSAGPFRSFARIAVEPRPYQLVPLLMALKLDPVRLLIADDVGIGKTVEACLIARELLDRGEVQRLAVLCPPHLAEQWQTELSRKFHIDAELVLPGTASRLERPWGTTESLFDHYPHVIVSLDFIKPDRRRSDFLRSCPELVIVDEAHTCTLAADAQRTRQQRHALVRDLAADPNRHMILVTATPHSGKEEAFRSLLGLLDPSFAGLPPDLTGEENKHHRRRLAANFVQRRRGDILHYLGADTTFPTRHDAEATYKLSPAYAQLFRKALDLAKATVSEGTGTQFQRRVHWWSAIALLRSVGSSPAAAAATLRNRSGLTETDTPDEANELGERNILDLVDDAGAEGADVAPGAQVDPDETGDSPRRRRMLALALEFERLAPADDLKLAEATRQVQDLLKAGFHPIVFCRFIPTAEYVGDHLRRALPKVTVSVVTGTLPPDDRQARIAELVEAANRVLVCTDCLSEGMNLQDGFDAVVHFDLSWNPTRHEQREGRVDRFGQPSKEVRALTIYGKDNPIDGIVLEILLRKHNTIRTSLGVSVPVPVRSEDVVEAIFSGLLLREQAGGQVQLYLPGFEEFMNPKKVEIHTAWELAADREKRSRTVFAQETIDPREVADELAAARQGAGSGPEVRAFAIEALKASKAVVSDNGVVDVDLAEAPRALRDAMGLDARLRAAFDLPVKTGVTYLSRTHPVVEGLATHVLDTALDPEAGGVARRCGVIRTRAVQRRTTLLLLRLRYHLITTRSGKEEPLLVEDAALAAFTGQAEDPTWLDSAAAEALLAAKPEQNVTPNEAAHFITQVLRAKKAWLPHLEELAHDRGKAILDAHIRVRTATKQRGVRHRVEPSLPVDVLGLYVLLPAGV